MNLVPNPSFESDDPAPIITNFNWHHYTNWRRDSISYVNDEENILAQNWFQATKGTPDPLNSDQSNLIGFKTKTARTGTGRMGIITGISRHGMVNPILYDNNTYSEYIECKLNQPLARGKIYCVRYYVALDRKSNFASNDFGAIVSRDEISYQSHTSIYPDESDVHINASENHFITSDEGWVMICDTFIAKGGEQFLTLGSFMGDFPKRIHQVQKSQHAGLRVTPFNKFAYYYVDDVSLTEVQPEEVLCEAPRDTGTRDNLVFMIDVSGSMEPKGYIAEAKSSILPLINSLPPGDHITIIAYSDNPVVLCDNTTAADTGVIRRSLDSIKPGGGTNVVGAFNLAYSILRKRMLEKGTNKIIVLTDGRIYVPKSEKKKIIAASENEKISLSIIFFGDNVPKEVEKFSHDAGGDASAAKNGDADEALRTQVPAHVMDTPYGTRNATKIFWWEFITKVAFPAAIVLLGLRAGRVI